MSPRLGIACWSRVDLLALVLSDELVTLHCGLTLLLVPSFSPFGFGIRLSSRPYYFVKRDG